MGARRAGESRFEAAKSDARSVLEGLSSAAQVGLFVASPQLHQVGAELLTPEAALLELETVQLAYAPDGLQNALTKLTQDTRFDRVVAFSDKTLSAPHARLQVRTPGVAKSANIALQEVSVESRPDGSAAVTAEIAAFSTRDATVAVHLTRFSETAGSFSGAKLAERQVVVPARGAARVELPVNLPAGSAFSVRIEPSSRAGEEDLNAIAEDDLAFVTASGGGNQLTVITVNPQVAESLRRLPAIAPVFMTPGQYSDSPPTDGIALFHRTVPDQLPGVNSLFVLPPPGSMLGGALVQGDTIAVSRWQDGHPLLRYLNTPLLSLRTLVPLRRPAWAEEIITSTEGTAAFAGEYAGHRYVGLGFELLPYGGRRDPLGSVLLLNALKWLSGSSLSAGYEVAPYRIPIVERSGQPLREVRYIAATAPRGLEGRGEERIAPVPGLLALGASGARSLRAINFFSEEESNTMILHSLEVPEGLVSATTVERGVQPLSDTLVWFVLGVLVCEGVALLWSVRRARAGGVAG
ncbi:MAG: hypothetical protein EBZ48_10100 [Proteobacteria bacterium]|nr:hypothetical protein [Pseudomonadota bacterium]